jgi:hypothetical protein
MPAQPPHSDRIEVNVLVDRQTMAGPIVDDRFESPLKQRPDSLYFRLNQML